MQSYDFAGESVRYLVILRSWYIFFFACKTNNLIHLKFFTNQICRILIIVVGRTKWTSGIHWPFFCICSTCFIDKEPFSCKSKYIVHQRFYMDQIDRFMIIVRQNHGTIPLYNLFFNFPRFFLNLLKLKVPSWEPKYF